MTTSARAEEGYKCRATHNSEQFFVLFKTLLNLNRFQNFVSDFASTSREDVFSSPEKIMLLNQVICQHFYRQGMLDIAQELAQVNSATCPKRVKPPGRNCGFLLIKSAPEDI